MGQRAQTWKYVKQISRLEIYFESVNLLSMQNYKSVCKVAIKLSIVSIVTTQYFVG